MTQRILYNTPTLTIAYDYGNDWLHLDWHGNLDDEAVMSGALKLLELLRQEQCARVLNDNTHISGLWADAARWGGEVFFPQLYQAGCRYFAWVHSPERYSQLSAQLALQHTAAGITFMTFYELKQAVVWLKHI